MITEEVMLKRFYQQNPDYIGKDIEIINYKDGYEINLIKKNGKREWLRTYRGEDVEYRVYGYARCSTNETRQDIDRQKRELKSLGVTDEKYIYWEYESGTKTDRVEFQKLLDVVESGDTIVTTEVSRLTRSTKHLCDIMQLVQDKKIKLVIGNFVVDCTADEIDPMTKGMLMMWGVFSEMERDIISQRVKSGMENAKEKGHKIGRPKVDASNLPEKFLKYYPMYKTGGINITDFANLLSCSRTTIYKYINLIEGQSK
ncbi:Site-specific DNA recombinase [Pseudobutyrivibrio sp. JW11]|uniref:recombinase family protein n=1 Tax=Pseudobutyrivibrio sp. JW11 TaxID=1855302 RepID=UPI0008E61798|nr:recombinase family protein [Pseudobutyrivibrio sp. JW11]SFO67467.1 Site-specific DNA recombinase [Pseudobutyrivibrio sp. JW11]